MSYTDLPFDTREATKILAAAADGADDGDIYVQRSVSEGFVFDDGRLKSATYDTTQGFGLRVVAGDASGNAHSGELTVEAIRRAAETARQAKRGYSGSLDTSPTPTNRQLYAPINPTEAPGFTAKTDLLAEIDAWVRAKDPRVVQVSVSLAGSHEQIDILRPRVNLESIPGPAGQMEVVLGPGWPAVLLHEAVGHGLEGDFNRKGTSVYSGRIGEQVASKGVTIIDDGTIDARRGSLSIDDEGTPTNRTVLIEDGVLKGYMQDRQNARLMGVAPTGNGRRESYDATIMPRMTNTVMLGGNDDPDEIVKSIKKGIWAVDFGGGQVDITSGNFVFQCTEAYLVENGKVIAPVKNATLIGHGPTALSQVEMIGNDFAMDDGVGTCGKAGQSVPVGVGQPTLKVGGLTVGGAG